MSNIIIIEIIIIGGYIESDSSAIEGFFRKSEDGSGKPTFSGLNKNLRVGRCCWAYLQVICNTVSVPAMLKTENLAQ